MIEGCSNYEVTGTQIKDFAGVGLQITRTNLQTSGFTNGGMVSSIATTGNYIGVRFDTRGEYVTASQLMCHYNVIGLRTPLPMCWRMAAALRKTATYSARKSLAAVPAVIRCCPTRHFGELSRRWMHS